MLVFLISDIWGYVANLDNEMQLNNGQWVQLSAQDALPSTIVNEFPCLLLSILFSFQNKNTKIKNLLKKKKEKRTSNTLIRHWQYSFQGQVPEINYWSLSLTLIVKVFFNMSRNSSQKKLHKSKIYIHNDFDSKVWVFIFIIWPSGLPISVPLGPILFPRLPRVKLNSPQILEVTKVIPEWTIRDSLGQRQ